MKQYIEALKYCFENGSDVESRAGKVRKNFGLQIRFDLQNGFPAMTTKKLAWKSVVSDSCGFLKDQMMKDVLLKYYMKIKEKI